MHFFVCLSNFPLKFHQVFTFECYVLSYMFILDLHLITSLLILLTMLLKFIHLSFILLDLLDPFSLFFQSFLLFSYNSISSFFKLPQTLFQLFKFLISESYHNLIEDILNLVNFFLFFDILNSLIFCLGHTFEFILDKFH